MLVNYHFKSCMRHFIRQRRLRHSKQGTDTRSEKEWDGALEKGLDVIGYVLSI